MRRPLIGALCALISLAAVPANAQQPTLLESCATVPESERPIPAGVGQAYQRLCAQVVTAMTELQPRVGMAFSGGNPVLGTGSTLGTRLGLPRISIAGRANALLVELPDVMAAGVGRLDAGSPALTALETVGMPIGAVQADLAIGLFEGLDLGPMIGGIGALDLLGSVAFVPTIDRIGLSEKIVNASVGGRLGVLRQGLVMPGVSVSGLYRRMGAVSFGNRDDGDAAEFSTDLSTLSVRAVASKGILAFDFAVGAGYDRYASDVAFAWTLECETEACTGESGQPIVIDGQAAGALTTAAWNVFADVALNLLVLNLVAELGYQQAMDVIGADDLDSLGLTKDELVEKADALGGGRVFGSLGVRIAL